MNHDGEPLATTWVQQLVDDIPEPALTDRFAASLATGDYPNVRNLLVTLLQPQNAEDVAAASRDNRE